MDYQKLGYYTSLLAIARKDKVLPSPRLIQDITDNVYFEYLTYELMDLIQSKLSKLKSDDFELSVYLGSNLAETYHHIARELFRKIRAPLFRVYFHRDEKWKIKSIELLKYQDLTESHQEFFKSQLKSYISKKRFIKDSSKQYLFDLAILVDPNENAAPSNPEALELFQAAFKKVGIRPEIVEINSPFNLADYDALFVRATTQVNHDTFKYASQAQQDGLVVYDDPESIIKCSNKIFLEQLMDRLNVGRPKTTILDKPMFKEWSKDKDLSFPLIIKKPDSAFSQGVHKAENLKELKERAKTMFESTELILIQEFLPTDFDWRIGILNNEVIYACKYFMAKGHWQIINNEANGEAHEGGFEALDPSDVPAEVKKAALKVAGAIGKGLYGVDLKQSGKEIYLIEVNDNPSIDHGVEDHLLKELLYDKIANHFLTECLKKVPRL